KLHDLAAFVEHFELFLGVAVVGEDVDLGDDVEGDLAGVDFRGEFVAGDDGLDLFIEFDDALGAGAVNGLVAGSDDGFEAEGFVQRGKGHQRDDGGAVGIGDDAAGRVFGGLRIDFGHDEGNVRVHAEGGGVVDHDGAGRG